MAEYWKSQPKKFCDFCKCWIADNKASVDFHEKGKKHQENVKLRIQEVKKKGSERREQQEQLHDDLAAIEAAALKAYKKDIGALNYAKEKNLPTTSKQEHKTKENYAENVDTSCSENDKWAAYQTPEGYWYYYNCDTGESTWDPPEGFSFSNQQNQLTLRNSEQSSVEKRIDVIENNEAHDQTKEESNDHNSPFGMWETVAIYERTGDSGTSEERPYTSQQTVQDKTPAVKFKEKQLPVTKKNDLSEENVTFKKRKSNQDKKRSIRQRIDDSS